jgi:hypothetical protein
MAKKKQACAKLKHRQLFFSKIIALVKFLLYFMKHENTRQTDREYLTHPDAWFYQIVPIPPYGFGIFISEVIG